MARRQATTGLFGRSVLELVFLAAAGCAVVVAAGLALIFAASIVVIAVMASALIGFAGLALQARRTARVRPASVGGQLIEARRIGHSWVAYSWDQR